MGTGPRKSSNSTHPYILRMNAQNKISKPPTPARRTRRRRRGARNKTKKSGSGKSTQRPVPIPGQVSVAAAYASGQRTRAPRIVNGRDQVRIIHRELIASVTGTTAFTVAQTVALNPGLSASFPWLATQAQAWERYRFNSLKFEYYTRTGSNTPGSVLMVPDYDAADSAPLSEQIASSYEDVAEDAPWKDICCLLRPSALHALGPTKFIRTGALSANLDVKTYDAGNFFMCTIDGTAASWGKLWVEYDVTLYTPQLNPAGSGVISAQHIIGATPTSASLLGTQTLQAGSSAIATVAGEIVTFSQAGKFSVTLLTIAGTSVTITGQPALSAGATFGSIDGSAAPAGAGSTTTACMQTMIVNVVVGSTLTFNNTVVAGTSADLLISQLPANLV